MMLHTNNPPVIKYKVGLIDLAEEFGSVCVSKAYKVTEFSGDIFYRCQESTQEDEVNALIAYSEI